MTGKLKFGVLGSTRGSTLQPILEAWRLGEFIAEPSIVVSNKRTSGILDRALNFNLPIKYLPVQGRTRKEYDLALNEVFEEAHVDIILLIGYMRILGPEFVKRWQHKALNVHPSLLPSYAGLMDMQIHDQVIQNGDTETGCTVHEVAEVVDTGPIVMQKKYTIREDDDAHAVKAAVQGLEGQAFIEILKFPQKYLKNL
jgi:phosphoribosylglycinamide formyltransferase-1